MEISEITKTVTVRLSGKVDPLSRDSSYATYEFTTTVKAQVEVSGVKEYEEASNKVHALAWEASLRDLESARSSVDMVDAVCNSAAADLSRRNIREANRAKQREE